MKQRCQSLRSYKSALLYQCLGALEGYQVVSCTIALVAVGQLFLLEMSYVVLLTFLAEP